MFTETAFPMLLMVIFLFKAGTPYELDITIGKSTC